MILSFLDVCLATTFFLSHQKSHNSIGTSTNCEEKYKHRAKCCLPFFWEDLECFCRPEVNIRVSEKTNFAITAELLPLHPKRLARVDEIGVTCENVDTPVSSSSQVFSAGHIRRGGLIRASCC
jgi:hypothetical protein